MDKKASDDSGVELIYADTGTCPLCHPVNAMVCCATPEEASIKHLSSPDNAYFMQNYEGLAITINPSVNLESNIQYYVNFPVDGYRDAADKNGWNFWTKSTPNTFSGVGL